MLKLYYAPHTCALATHITLIEANASYETVRLDFAKGEQTEAAYLAINPKGRVPALITKQGALTETPAILHYLAQSFPEAALAPIDDPFLLGQAQAFNSYLCSTVHVAHAHRMRGTRWANDPNAIADMQRKVPESVLAAFKLIEDGLDGPWVMGTSYSVCDAYLFTIAQWLEGDGVNPDQLPRVRDHRTRMLERPATVKAIAEQTA